MARAPVPARGLAVLAVAAALLCSASGCGDDEPVRGDKAPAGATATPTPDRPSLAY